MPTGHRAGAARTAALALVLGWLVAACGATAGPPAPTAATDASSRSPPAVAAAPAATAAPPLASIRIPYAAISIVILPLWVALDGGYFTQEGLEATIELISTGPTLTQAMLAGEVAMAYSGLEASVSATLAGTDVVILGAGTDRFLFRLYGTPGMTGFADLRGKRVGITRIGTATDVLARLLLQRNGLEPDRDAPIVQTGGVPEILAAMQAGAVDGGVLSPPTMFGAEAAGYARLADTTEIDIPFHQAVLMSTRRFTVEQPDQARRAMRAYLRGVARLKQDRAYAKQVLGQWTRSDDAAVLDESVLLLDGVLGRVPYPRPAAIQLALDAVLAQNPSAATRPVGDFSDDRLLREQEDNGFVASLYR